MSMFRKRPAMDREPNWEVIRKLCASQEEIDEINGKATNEILEVEDKYNVLKKPLYEERSKLIKRISHFWGATFYNHRKAVGALEMEDECLYSLEKLEVKYAKSMKKGYSLEFYFGENPYFKNKVLTKKFRFRKEENGDGAYSTSSRIKWKRGIDLPSGITTASCKSFFDWFMDNTNPDMDHIAELIRDDIWPNPLLYYCADVESEDEKDDNE